MQAVSMNGSHRGKSVYVEVPEIGFLLNLYSLTFGQKIRSCKFRKTLNVESLLL